MIRLVGVVGRGVVQGIGAVAVVAGTVLHPGKGFGILRSRQKVGFVCETYISLYFKRFLILP